MKVISRVVFRCDQDAHDYDGHSQNWHGEDSYGFGETYKGLPIVNIALEQKGGVTWVEIFVQESETEKGLKLVCSIPIHAVNRLYYEDL